MQPSITSTHEPSLKHAVESKLKRATIKDIKAKANEGRFRVADQGEMTIYNTLEEARVHAEIAGSPIWDMDKKEYAWLDPDWVE